MFWQPDFYFYFLIKGNHQTQTQPEDLEELPTSHHNLSEVLPNAHTTGKSTDLNVSKVRRERWSDCRPFSLHRIHFCANLATLRRSRFLQIFHILELPCVQNYKNRKSLFKTPRLSYYENHLFLPPSTCFITMKEIVLFLNHMQPPPSGHRPHLTACPKGDYGI